MSKLPVISGVACVKALKQVEFEFNRQHGSHMILVRTEPKATIVVPDHKELDEGLYAPLFDKQS